MDASFSLEKAKQEKLFYVVVTGVIYRTDDSRCLILKRSESEVTHGGKWGVVGGKLEWNDLLGKPPTRVNGDVLDWEHEIESLLRREAKEEANVEVGDFRYLDSVAFRRPDAVPVMCLKFACRYVSGEVHIPQEFSEFAWVTAAEARTRDCIMGIPEEVEKTIEIFKS